MPKGKYERINLKGVDLKGFIVSSDALHKIFNYKDGMLFWKIKTRQPQQKIGDRAGSTKENGYREIIIGKVSYKEHRLIWILHFGLTSEFIDHIDRDPSNNRIENLRLATRGQNSHNRTKYKTNTSGFKGVSFFKAGRKWHARIMANGVDRHLGYYNTPEDAHFAYKTAAIELHGSYAQF
jgi:hypothetical protein